jgi:energy-coupling factor transporter ATP-binding protein EcfA2
MTDPFDSACAPTAAWLDRVVAEIVRGRHLIVHGNVRDPVRWRDEYVGMRRALTGILQISGYQTIGYYDVVDGVSTDDGHDPARLQSLLEGPRREPDAAAAADDPPPATRTGAQRRSIQRLVQGASAPAPPSGAASPDDALAGIRRALAQGGERVAFIVDFAELLVPDPEHAADRADRRLLGLLKKAMLEAAYVGHLRNLLILVVHDLPALPEWLYQGEPFVQPIEALRPTFDERRAFLRQNAAHFFDDLEGEPWTADSIRVLANLTEGMAVTELEGLWRTSTREAIGLNQPRELLNRTVVGRRLDPWRRLAGRIGGAEEELARRVVGQPVATRRVSQALAAATLGIDFVADPHNLEARPKGVFFFVGPTGVGKTELAKALSELIYDDAAALARFDMSSFAEPHSAERFTGAPPGYLGHERGGELTNRVRQRPFSLLLFDEIEKAHDSIFDRFLQILDDGRLTDGLGRTSYFSNTLVVFTSNLGARTIYEKVAAGSVPSYEEVVEQFEDAVRAHFTGTLNRPELLGRLGNGIVPFDILRPDNVDRIALKFLGQLRRTAARTAELHVDEDSVLAMVRRRMDEPAALALGARRIRDILDEAVRAPLVDQLVEHGAGAYDVWIPEGADTARVARGTVAPL